MRGLGTGLLFLLWMVLLKLGSCNYAEIIWGRCYAFCLTRHEARQKEKDADFEPVSPDSIIRVCKKDKVCKWCLYACERPREDYDDLDDCLNDCKNARKKLSAEALQACYDSCSFISRSSQFKYGNCPAPTMMTGFRIACVRECQRDVDCDGMQKCCENDCGQVCHKPLEPDVLPGVSSSLDFKIKSDGGIAVEWKEETKASVVKPVIYILRWWCPYTPSVSYSVTTRTQVKLKGYPRGIQPGVKCSFMVAATNIHGSAGFSEKHTYVKKFLNPSPPLNLEKARSKLHNGKINVTIRWQPPLHTDGFPVSKYMVFWSDNLPDSSHIFSRLHMFKKTLNVPRTSYTLQGLNPGTFYFVQVKAVVIFEGKTIRGEPESIYIETDSFPQPPGLDTEGSQPGGSPYAGDSHVHSVTVHEPVFVHSQLRANVTWLLYPGARVEKYIIYWTKDVCDEEAKHRKTKDRIENEAASTKKEFQLYDLHFDCVYELRIHTVDFHGEMCKGVRQFFKTPPCWETKGVDLIVCPPKVSPPSPPTDLSVHFKSSNCICQAVVSWQRPSGETYSITQFFILWGQSRPPPEREQKSGLLQQSSAVVYNAHPYRSEVPGNGSRACMTYLEIGKHYTVQVISQAAKVKSIPAVYHFTTPEDLPPCYGLNTGVNSTLLDSPQTLAEESTTLAAVTWPKNSGPQGSEPKLLCLLLLLWPLCILLLLTD